MYENPINITTIYDDISSQIQKQTEALVFQEIQRVGVYVDKEELIKALKYDRGQYIKGYNNAIDEFVNRAYLHLGSEDYDIYCKETIKEIAEQMKAGGKNEID